MGGLSRVASFSIFLSVALSLVAALHGYVWLRLVHDVALPHDLERAGTALVVALFVGMPLTFYLGRTRARGHARLLLLFGFGWLGLLFFLLVLLGAADLARVGVALVREQLLGAPPPDAASRLSVSRWTAGAVLFGATLMTLASLRSGLGQVRVRDVEVELPRLPAALDGFVIVQLSDVHVGPTIGRQFVEYIVQRCNALTPDIVVITGDLVDGSVSELASAVAPLASLQARHGTYFVTGNHEYYSGASAWCRELTRLGIRVLRNERVSIAHAGAEFDLAGVDDYSAHRVSPDHGANLPRALTGRDPSRELVLLAHQPRAIFEAERLGVGLQLSGHTHGGQLWPWNFLVRLQQPVVSGLNRFGQSQLYVSNGTGYWGPPMRLGAPAEITRIVLRASTSAGPLL
jgi:predicted MPP superfamily phosphohydrolase